jgi:hypothetical protein
MKENHIFKKEKTYYEVGKYIGRHGSEGELNGIIDNLNKNLKETQKVFTDQINEIESIKERLVELESNYKTTVGNLRPLRENKKINPGNSFYIKEFGNNSSVFSQSPAFILIFILAGIASYIIGTVALTNLIISIFKKIAFSSGTLLTFIMAFFSFSALSGQVNFILLKKINSSNQEKVSNTYNFIVLGGILIFLLSFYVFFDIAAVYFLLIVTLTGSLLLPIGIDLFKYYRRKNALTRTCRKIEKKIEVLYLRWGKLLEEIQSVKKKDIQKYDLKIMENIDELRKGFTSGEFLKKRVENLKHFEHTAEDSEQ